MISRMRLTTADWKLILEALQMLALDYEDGHAEQGRLDALLEYALWKGYGG